MSYWLAGEEDLDSVCSLWTMIVISSLLIEDVPDSELHQLPLRAGWPLCHCQGPLSGDSI